MDQKDYRLAAIMFTDIVGFSLMMGKDEVATLKLMEFHNDLVAKQVKTFNGKTIKTIGDAFLVEFPTATNAVKCAVAIQRDLEDYNATRPAMALIVRIGVHLGDIYFSDNDALGEGINIASRLQSLCRPGRVCISSEVHNLVANKVELPIQALGQVTLKNISRPLNAFEIMTNGSAEAPAPAAPAPLAADPPEPAAEAAAPAAGEAIDREAAEQRLRGLVFQQIKLAGRRLSVDEVREALRPVERGAATDAFLEKLADGGFLARRAGGAEGGRPDRGDDGDDYDWRGKYTERYERFREMAERERDEYRDRRHDHRHIGREIAREVRHEVFEAISQEMSRERRPVTFDQYMERLDKKMAAERQGFLGHLRSYLGVNGLLWAIGLATGSAFAFPWPLIVTLAWGIGIASHAAGYRDKLREAGQLKGLPSLDQKQFGLVRRLFKIRRAWNSHLASNLAVGVFLACVNLITSAAFPWALFPIAGMAIGLFAHLPSFKSREQDLLGQLAAEGVPVEALTGNRGYKAVEASRSGGGAGPLAAEAERIRQRILRQAKGLKGPNPLGDDFESVLDNYISQIKELSLRDRDIDNIIATIPVRDLDKELAAVQAELAQASDQRMRVEYEKAADQIEKQKKAYGEMVSEQKVLKLRLSNAVNSLKQLEIDLARMSSLSSGKDMAAAGPSIRDKSNELNQYLSDLRSGYQEIDALEKGFFGLEAELAKGPEANPPAGGPAEPKA